MQTGEETGSLYVRHVSRVQRTLPVAASTDVRMAGAKDPGFLFARTITWSTPQRVTRVGVT
jgi:hypothetical protein